MKLNTFFVVLVSVALCSAVSVNVDNTASVAEFDILNNAPSLSVSPGANAAHLSVQFINSAPVAQCSWVHGQANSGSIFQESSGTISLKTETTLEDLLECDFQENHSARKRAYSDVTTGAVRDDYNVIWNTLEIKRVQEDQSSSTVQQDIELWYPKNVVAKKQMSAFGRQSFISSATMEVSYNPRPSSLWTVKITFATVDSDYTVITPDTDLTVTGRDVSTPTVSGNVVTFTVNGDCQGWSTTAGGKLTVQRDGSEVSDPAKDNVYSISEDIDVSIKTVSACALTQGFNFGTPVVVLYEGSIGGDTKLDAYKKSDTVYLSVKLESTGIDALSYEISSICQEDGTTGECDATKPIITVLSNTEGTSSDEWTVGASFAALDLRKEPDLSTASKSFNLLIQIDITVDSAGRKRSVVLRKAHTVVKVSDDSIAHSSASLASIGALFMVLLVLLA